VSGKTVAVSLVLTLLVVSVLVGKVSLDYGTFNETRRGSDRAWRVLADELRLRYETLDAQVAADSAAGRLDSELAQRWQTARGRFSGSFGVERQAAAGMEVEQRIAELQTARGDAYPLEPTPGLAAAVEAYNAAVAQQQRDGQLAGMRILATALILHDPVVYQLTR
jgi:hypothetical protein